MAYNVFRTRLAQQKNIDSLNRRFIHTTDLPNGAVFSCGTKSATDEGCWLVAAPDAYEENLWVAMSPEVTYADKTQGGSFDPRDFVNKANKPFDAVKLVKNDICEFTGAGITGIASTGDTYLTVDTGYTFLVATGAPVTGGITLYKVDTDILRISDGTIATPSSTYIFEVTRN